MSDAGTDPLFRSIGFPNVGNGQSIVLTNLCAPQATFIAEIGDIWRFEDFDQLAAYAGVHPKEQSSGTKGQNPETSWHMAKTGNAFIRSAAYRMAVVGTQHNPVIRAHYLRKRA